MSKTNRMAIPCVLGVLLVSLCGNAVAADSPSKLRSEMAKTERAYVDLYNKLNTDPQFAIVCKMDTPTGSSFAVRVCHPRYQLQAAEKSATENMQAAISASDTAGPANARGPNVGAAAGGSGAVGRPDKDEAFKQHMLDVQQKSPELQALGLKRDDLQVRYAEVTKGKSAQ